MVPIVFAGSGGAAEIVTAAEGGIIYEKQKPECLAKALRDTLELGREEKVYLINNGRSWMAEKCSPQICGQTIFNIFSSVCDLRSRIVHNVDETKLRAFEMPRNGSRTYS